MLVSGRGYWRELSNYLPDPLQLLLYYVSRVAWKPENVALPDLAQVRMRLENIWQAFTIQVILNFKTSQSISDDN